MTYKFYKDFIRNFTKELTDKYRQKEISKEQYRKELQDFQTTIIHMLLEDVKDYTTKLEEIRYVVSKGRDNG